MRVLIISPVDNRHLCTHEDLAKLDIPDNIECEIKICSNGLSEIIDNDDTLKASQSVKALAIQYENEFDFILVDCFGEPGVQLSRQSIDTPVFGIAELSFKFVSLATNKFGVISALENHGPILTKLADSYGVESSLIETLPVGISPKMLKNDDGFVEDSVFKLIKNNFKRNNIKYYILGCGFFIGKRMSIERKLFLDINQSIRMIDPIEASLNLLSATGYLMGRYTQVNSRCRV